MRAPRDYQREAIAATRAAWARGVLRPALVKATGLGKTDDIAVLATEEAAVGGTALCLGHRGELLDQIAGRCRAYRPDISVGRVEGTVDQRGFPITVASVPTLAREARRARLRRPTLVIYDECHHAPSPSGRAIMAWAGCYDDVRAVGVTATLVRGDKYKPSSVWQEVVYERDIGWAVSHGPVTPDGLTSGLVERGRGWLVPPRGRMVVADHVDLKAAKMNSRGTDYADGELGDMVEQDVDQIVKAWLEHASDRITVAFTPTVASARALADEFLAAGVAAECVFGSTSAAQRGSVEKGTGIYGRLARGETRVLCGVMVASEGWDCPPVSCVLMARPTKLPGLYAQIVGRGLRPYPGKVDCLVLDVVGASRGQRLVGLTDLSPAFEVDTSEVEALPCDQCQGFRPAAVRANPGLDACSCDRSDGAAPKVDRKVVGPVRYVDLDLLSSPSASFRWLRTGLGIPFLIGSLPWTQGRAVCLYPCDGTPESPTWTVGWVAVKGPAEAMQLHPERGTLSFADAKVAAQVWAGPSQKRRKGPVEDWMVGKARAAGVDVTGLDRVQVLDAIEVARVSRVVDR